VLCSQNTENEEKQFIAALNVMRNCGRMGMAKAITQVSTSNLVTSSEHIQNVQLIKFANFWLCKFYRLFHIYKISDEGLNI
jgi:hypothetical protein